MMCRVFLNAVGAGPWTRPEPDAPRPRLWADQALGAPPLASTSIDARSPAQGLGAQEGSRSRRPTWSARAGGAVERVRPIRGVVYEGRRLDDGGWARCDPVS